MSLIATDPLWITANFKETQVGRVRVGQNARVTVDAFPGHAFEGVVESLAPATGAKFSLLPQENATGNFTKFIVGTEPFKTAVGTGSQKLRESAFPEHYPANRYMVENSIAVY